MKEKKLYLVKFNRILPMLQVYTIAVDDGPTTVKWCGSLEIVVTTTTVLYSTPIEHPRVPLYIRSCRCRSWMCSTYRVRITAQLDVWHRLPPLLGGSSCGGDLQHIFENKFLNCKYIYIDQEYTCAVSL